MVIVEAPSLCLRDEKGEGGEFFAGELCKAVAFFNFTHSDGSSWQPSDGRQAIDMGNSSSAPLCKEFVLGSPSFAEVLGGMGKPSICLTGNGSRPRKSLTNPLISYVIVMLTMPGHVSMQWRVLVGFLNT